ncbi:hypothetical protein H5410_028977 [Solanum commersonii]|uniref:Uncharacterized protein n=1 Tax=Solanum commersonii TaxID=4109 RepID=A0A9J5Z5I2_SOLCO|nr:hypothetical protein H5410_028977 [Solanum commersonii]
MSMIVDLKEEGDDDLLVQLPPTNFSAVENNYIYRSGIHHPSNFTFLQPLSLRSIIYLCTEPYPEENIELLRSNNIKLYPFGMDGTRMHQLCQRTSEIIMDGLRVITDERNHLILVHCKRGKHQTDCVVECLRKLQNWCLDVVVEEEFKHFAGAKWRETDLKILDVQILFEYFKYLL